MKILGNYSGVFSPNPNQFKTLNIDLDPLGWGIRIKGFGDVCPNNPNTNIVIGDYQPTYKQMYFFFRGTDADPNGQGCISNAIGIMKVHGRNSDSLTINYRVYDFTNPNNINMNPPMRTFKGKRIP
jgi:hypothetical protein